MANRAFDMKITYISLFQLVHISLLSQRIILRMDLPFLPGIRYTKLNLVVSKGLGLPPFSCALAWPGILRLSRIYVYSINPLSDSKNKAEGKRLIRTPNLPCSAHEIALTTNTEDQSGATNFGKHLNCSRFERNSLTCRNQYKFRLP